MIVLGDFTTSLAKAFDEIDPDWRLYDGLVVAGTHKPDGIEYQIDLIRSARESGKPFLGICHGQQVAFIEYCRNVLSIKDATSEEYGYHGTIVVKKRSELLVGLHDGESYWSYYEIDQTIPWKITENFIVTAGHPEYQSSVDKPHPLLIQFIELCKQYSGSAV